MKKTLLVGTIIITMLSGVFSQDQSELPDATSASVQIQTAFKSEDLRAPGSLAAVNALPGKEKEQTKAKMLPETKNNSSGNMSEGKQSDPTDAERNKFEVYAGYSGATLYSSVFEPIENGFNVSAVYYIQKYVGAKLDFSGTYRSVGFGINLGDHSLYNLTGGVQFKDSSKDTVLKPFAHLMFGLGKHKDKYQSPIGQPFDFDFNGFSTVVGGGLDIKVHPRIDIRVIQADINPIFYKLDGTSSHYDNFRFGAGIVFKF